MNRRSLILSGLGAALGACTHIGQPISIPLSSDQRAYGFDAIKPLDLTIGNLSKITVCTRPFRPAGPRLELEDINGKTVIHNYGHGGAGWSLAWGYAENVRDLVIAQGAKAVSIVGAGAMGLTSAIAIAESGIDVTLIARELPMESRSARATGVWSPSSRIGFKDAVDARFAENWEALARRSYARHLRYIGRAGQPVEFTPRFSLRSPVSDPPLVVTPASGDQFLHLNRLTRDMLPRWGTLEETPFAGNDPIRGGLVMTFNIAEYMRQLVDDFLALGGQIERAEISSKDELSRLPGQAVINCTGYDAKALVGDSTLIPVRGQIACMPPQTDRLYGVHYRNVMALSRRDGLLIQETGGNDYFGFNDGSETQDMNEFLAAHAKIAPVFDWSPTA